MTYSTHETRIGRITIAERDGRITNVFWTSDGLPEGEPRETELLREAHRQLSLYLDGKLKRFDLPLAPQGTAFMLRVWERLIDIPYGETASYGEIAARAGNPKAVRAVGQANHKNPIPIFIPCHRVIGADGKLVGYGGGLPLKSALLALEKDNG